MASLFEARGLDRLPFRLHVTAGDVFTDEGVARVPSLDVWLARRTLLANGCGGYVPIAPAWPYPALAAPVSSRRLRR